jgi:spore maturation protein CgeD
MLQRLTFTNFLLCVVDDDSENSLTLQVLKEFEQELQIDILYNKLNGAERTSRVGYSQCINLALDKHKDGFDYVTYLTCDDLFYPGRLRRMVEYLDLHPDVMVCYGVQRIVRLKGFDGGVPVVEHVDYRDRGEIVTRASCQIDHNSVMHRYACVDICGRPLWPTASQHWGAADAAVWDKFNSVGWAFHRIPGGATDEHRWHKNSIQGL